MLIVLLFFSCRLIDQCVALGMGGTIATYFDAEYPPFVGVVINNG